jgi:lysophospholipase L1-like esterase
MVLELITFVMAIKPYLHQALGLVAMIRAYRVSQYADYQYSVIMKMYQAPDNNTNPTGAKYYSIHPQDINTVLPGYNDVTNFGGDMDHLNKFIQELTVGLTHLGQMGNKTFVGTTLYASTQMQNEQIHFHTNANVDLYVNAIKQVINLLQNQGLPIYLVDTNAVYDPNTMSTGNIHPNNAGHQVLANAFIQVYEANK